MICEKVLEYRKNKAKIWPCKSNRASEIGHNCLRYLVYSRTRWQEKLLPEPILLSIFEEGNIHEAAVIRLLQDAGFTILEQQRAFSWDRYNITGHIDGKIIIEGEAFPFDIKSMSQNSYNSVNCIKDMINSKFWWVRKYPWQLQAYLLMDNKKEGVFICKSKATGELKEIWMSIDYDMGEKLIQKAEAINKHIIDKTLPEPTIDEDICPRCDFKHICLPDMKLGAEIKIENDLGFINELNRRNELMPYVKEYEEVDERIKKKLIGKEKIMAGNWFISGKLIKRSGYTTIKPSEYWKHNIVKVQEQQQKAA